MSEVTNMKEVTSHLKISDNINMCKTVQIYKCHNCTAEH